MNNESRVLDSNLIKIRPSKRQIDYLQEGFWGFVHYTVNTYTGKEWGDGTESPSCFDPSELDADQWAVSMKKAGIKGLILTCKHHDGFCLWPSKYTEHSVKNSPYKNGNGDVVRELSDACHRHGLKFGVYLSPWDRNSKFYGHGKAYDDYYINQLTELLTGYGEIAAIWLDGACGENSEGKIQQYDWDRYYSVMRKLQPNAVISISGPDIRWCGNEAGIARKSEWSVVSAGVADPKKTADLSQKEDNKEFRQQSYDPTTEDLGSREALKDIPDLIYYPAEVDVSIRPGWFYHAEEDDQVRSVENLFEIYSTSVGGNATLLLNVPVMPDGKMHETDCERLEGLGEKIRRSFSKNLIDDAILHASDGKDGCSIDAVKNDDLYDSFEAAEEIPEMEILIDWNEKKTIKYVVLQENISLSQRVEAYTISYKNEAGEYVSCYEGTTIGFKKIAPLGELVTDGLKIAITDSRVKPIISNVAVY